MSRYSQLSAAIARGKAVVDRLESELAQCRADPVRAHRSEISFDARNRIWVGS
jgi:hypothetical protein